MDFNNYLFHPHSVGNIMGGVPKLLTEEQEITYSSLLSKHKSNNKNLTFAQMKRYAYLINKHKNPEKELTENQRNELFELILKYESTGKNLTLNQIETLGDLHRKKKGRLKLDDRAKSFLEKLVWQSITKRSHNLSTLMTDKGLQVEEKSITLFSEVTKSLFIKNKKRRTNEFFNGECDNAQNNTIRDIKSSWEFETFPLKDSVIPSSLYQWQLDGYMSLWEYKKSELIYCLVDTPKRLIDDLLSRMDWKNNIFDNDGNVRSQNIDLVVETVCNHIYTLDGLKEYCAESENINLEWFNDVFVEIPKEIRVKVFSHAYCQKRIDQLEQMILLAREYMNEVLEDLGGSIVNLKKFKPLKSA